jgi:hypothetical protein
MPISDFVDSELRSDAGSRSKGSPIVVLASGERSGSTLVQRYLCSHPGVHIWGELGGNLDLLVELVNRLEDRSMQYSDVADRYATEGTREFIANLTPPVKSTLAALRAFIEVLFAGTWPRWGFKEVRWSEGMVRLIDRSFPEARFLGIIRDIDDSLSSLLAWRWSRAACVEFCNRWLCQTSTLLRLQEAKHDRLLIVRYENLIVVPEVAGKVIPEFVGLPCNSFDTEVMAFRVADHQRRGIIEQAGVRARKRLPKWAELLVSQPEISRVRQAAGYLSSLNNT